MLRAVAYLLFSLSLTFGNVVHIDIDGNEGKPMKWNAKRPLSSTVCTVSKEIDSILRSSIYDRSQWGVLIEEILPNGTSRTIYDYDAGFFFTPASNNKILTTSAALFSLTTDYYVETPVYINTTDPGHLCVLGMADPSMTFRHIHQLAKRLRSNPIIPDKVQLFFDDSLFQGFPTGWEWSDVNAYYGAQPTSFILNEQTYTITIEPAAVVGETPVFTFRNNVTETFQKIDKSGCTTGPAGSTPILEAFYSLSDTSVLVLEGSWPLDGANYTFVVPALNTTLYFAATFEDMMKRVGFEVQGWAYGSCAGTSAFEGADWVREEEEEEKFKGMKMARKKRDKLEFDFDFDFDSKYAPPAPPAGWKQVDRMQSKNLTTMMNHTLQFSDNLYAETWLRHTGYQMCQDGSYAGSLACVSLILENVLGVNSTLFVQADGSGLSRHNLLSPRAIVETLKSVSRNSTFASTFLEFLPVAGETGTLAGRYIGTPAQGILHAKTGTMNAVNALSGWVFPLNYPNPIVFSMINNVSPLFATPVRDAMDEIGVLLANLTVC